MYRVDLNCDMGESFGAYTMGMDDQVIPYISSANIACGFHAGDPLVMEKTVELARCNGTAVGAHPGFPDLQGFGRRNLQVTPQEAKAYILYQTGALYAICRAHEIPLKHIKPHGALYNMAAKDYTLARAIAEGISQIDENLVFLGLCNSMMQKAAREVGIPFASEVFADRAYQEDGTLVPRSQEGAMITDEDLAVSRVIRMIKDHKVTSISGKEISIQPDSVCIHGDSPKALAFARKIRESLEKEGIAVWPLE